MDPSKAKANTRPMKPSKKPPLSGAWYWFPKPFEDGVQWSILTCHDAGFKSETGHARLWLWVLDQLAAAWNRDADQLKRRLGLYYTGLPRGRVSRPEKTSLILHGDDAPITGWRNLVVERFQLSDAKIKVLFDEHETQIIGHPEEFTSVFSRVQPIHDR